MSMMLVERAKAHLLESAELKRQMADSGLETVLKAASLIANSFRSGHKLLLCGNGGSAADCQHMATEFVGRLTKDYQRPGLPAIALTTDTSFITAHANDIDFADIFARQVEALGVAGDVLLGISTSGNSPNVLQAIQRASRSGLTTIGLTGNGGKLLNLADVCISIPSLDTQYIQEAHLTIEHILCDLVEVSLRGSSS